MRNSPSRPAVRAAASAPSAMSSLRLNTTSVPPFGIVGSKLLTASSAWSVVPPTPSCWSLSAGISPQMPENPASMPPTRSVFTCPTCGDSRVMTLSYLQPFSAFNASPVACPESSPAWKLLAPMNTFSQGACLMSMAIVGTLSYAAQISVDDSANAWKLQNRLRSLDLHLLRTSERLGLIDLGVAGNEIETRDLRLLGDAVGDQLHERQRVYPARCSRRSCLRHSRVQHRRTGSPRPAQRSPLVSRKHPGQRLPRVPSVTARAAIPNSAAPARAPHSGSIIDSLSSCTGPRSRPPPCAVPHSSILETMPASAEPDDRPGVESVSSRLHATPRPGGPRQASGAAGGGVDHRQSRLRVSDPLVDRVRDRLERLVDRPGALLARLGRVGRATPAGWIDDPHRDDPSAPSAASPGPGSSGRSSSRCPPGSRPSHGAPA